MDSAAACKAGPARAPRPLSGSGAGDGVESNGVILAPALCEAVLVRLLDAQPFWIERHHRFPFHTLGATNYYDIVANPARPYRRLAQQYNPFLLDQFGDIYTVLLNALRERLAAPVAFLSGAALPGFHLFGADPAFEAEQQHNLTHEQWFARRAGDAFPGNPIHVDGAHLALGLPAAPRYPLRSPLRCRARAPA